MLNLFNWLLLGSILMPVSICFMVAGVCMLFYFFRANLQEKILFLVLYGTVIIGFFFRFIHVSGISSLVILVLILNYLIYCIQKKKITFNYLFLLFQLLILNAVFLYWYLRGPKIDYSLDKYIGILTTSFLGAFQFIFLFELQKIRPAAMAPLFTATTIFMICSVLLFHYHETVLYANVFRILYYNNLDNSFNYQSLTIPCCYATVFTMEAEIDSWIWKLRLLSCIFYCAIISGGRQVMICVLLCILAVYYLTQSNKSNKSNKKRIMSIVSLTIVILISVQLFFTINFQRDSIWYNVSHSRSLFEMLNRSENTIPNIKEGLLHTPWLGTGLGGYYYKFKKNYPHNFFLEVIYEMGIVGLILLMIPFLLFCREKNFLSFFIIKSRASFFLFPFFLIYFSRSMISDGLNFSVYIVVFVCVLLTSSVTKNWDLNSD